MGFVIFMKNIVWILIGALVLVGIVALFVFSYVDSLPEKVVTASKSMPSIPVNYSNFAKVISSDGIVKAVPEGSAILLRFYNFDSGQREFEKSYLITTGKIVEGNGDSEITLLLHSKYLKELTNKNFCSIIKKANTNGDLGFETEMSSASLAWKFRSMLKYKECLGI